MNPERMPGALPNAPLMKWREAYWCYRVSIGPPGNIPADALGQGHFVSFGTNGVYKRSKSQRDQNNSIGLYEIKNYIYDAAIRKIDKIGISVRLI